MKKPTFLFIAFLIAINLHAQDSLRLTLKLDGFSSRDKIYLFIGDKAYKVDPNQATFHLKSSVPEPTMAMIRFKNRVQTFWIENGEITAMIPKRGFIGGLKVSGSSSQSLWERMIEAEPESRAKLVEANLNNPIGKKYLASYPQTLSESDRKRLIAAADSKTEEKAKYDIKYVDVKRSTRLNEGGLMMDFEAKTFNDEVVRTSDLRGKYIILEFASTGCSWCWVAYPEMIKSVEGIKNLEILTFNMDYNPEAWQQRADKASLNLPWPVLWKAENKREIFIRYGINVLPTYYLISPEGKILERWLAGREEKINRILERHNIQEP